MGVSAVREQAVRTANVSLPDAPRFERKFLVSADPGTSAQEVVSATGVGQWDPHPEYGFARAKTFGVAPGGSRWHWEVTIGYEVPEKESQDQHPLARPDEWSFSVGGAQVPALTRWEGDQQVPLTNTAGDYFEGLMTLEAEVRASISGNRAVFPLDLAVQTANTVNAEPYLGAPARTWLCAGISGQQAVEVFQDAEVRFYKITVELVYRASGHNLLLPNVGYNFVAGGKKSPCWVWATDAAGNPTNKKIRAASPQKLTPTGDIDPTIGPPMILDVSVYRATSFSVFGSPDF